MSLMGQEDCRYIELIAEASYEQTIRAYRMDINISVTASKKNTALDESVDLRNRCINTLLKAGLEESELTEGGAQVWQPWFRKKQQGQYANHKIMVTCEDIERLTRALDAVEPLFKDQRYTLDVSMQRPLFADNDEAETKAQKQALGSARQRASAIAAEAGVRLGGVLQIEQFEARAGRSGTYGDQDWGYAVLDAGAMGAPGGGEQPYINLQEASREVKVKYRIRFALEQGSDAPLGFGTGKSG